MMKKLAPVLIMSVMFVTPVVAEKGHDHGNGKGQTMNGKMMTQEQMMAMQAHMQKMQATMKDIMQETDPEKRNKLMQVHMEQMQNGMQVMNHGKAKPMKPMNMEDRMGMMEERMGMMQMMMGQLMEHESQEKKTRKYPRKK